MEITNSFANHFAYAIYLNKDNLHANMRQSNQVTTEQEKQNQDRELEKMVEHQELTKEQTVAVYYNYQNNQAMKQRMEIMIENEEEQEESTLSYQEVQDLQTQKNRNELLEHYANNPEHSNELNIRF